MNELERQKVLHEVYRLEQQLAFCGSDHTRHIVGEKLAWQRALLDPGEEKRRRMAARP